MEVTLYDNSVANSAQHEFCDRVDIELFHDARSMGLDRVKAETQPIGDVFIGLPFRQHVIKLALTLGAVGNVHTETLRLFGEADLKKLVAALP